MHGRGVVVKFTLALHDGGRGGGGVKEGAWCTRCGEGEVGGNSFWLAFVDPGVVHNLLLFPDTCRINQLQDAQNVTCIIDPYSGWVF